MAQSSCVLAISTPSGFSLLLIVSVSLVGAFSGVGTGSTRMMLQRLTLKSFSLRNYNSLACTFNLTLTIFWIPLFMHWFGVSKIWWKYVGVEVYPKTPSMVPLAAEVRSAIWMFGGCRGSQATTMKLKFKDRFKPWSETNSHKNLLKTFGKISTLLGYGNFIQSWHFLYPVPVPHLQNEKLEDIPYTF